MGRSFFQASVLAVLLGTLLVRGIASEEDTFTAPVYLVLEEGLEYSGELTADKISIPRGTIVTVSGDLILSASQEIDIAGVLTVQDAVGTASGKGGSIQIISASKLTVRGTILGGTGWSCPVGNRKGHGGVRGGNGGDITLSAPDLLVSGLVRAGDGGEGGPGGDGGNGGGVSIIGVPQSNHGLSPQDLDPNRVAFRGGDGGHPGTKMPELPFRDGGDGGDGGGVQWHPHPKSVSASRSEAGSSDSHWERADAGYCVACPVHGLNGTDAGAATGGDAAPGDDGDPGTEAEPDGGDGGNAGNSPPISGATGGNAGNGAHCCAPSTGQGGNGGIGGRGGDATAKPGGKGGNGGEAWKNPDTHEYMGAGGKGGNAGSGGAGTGGKAGDGGNGGNSNSTPGAAGQGGTPGTGKGGGAGGVGTGGAGAPTGDDGSAGGSGGSTPGGQGGQGDPGASCGTYLPEKVGEQAQAAAPTSGVHLGGTRKRATRARPAAKAA